MLDLRVEAGRGREHEAERKGHHDDDMAEHQPGEGAAEADLGEIAQEGDAEYHLGNHQRGLEECRERLAAGKAMAREC